MRKFLLLVLTSLVLTACLPTPDPDPAEEDVNAGSSTSTSSQTGVESQNPKSKKEKVLGQDKNGDGIRDDIEEWLSSQSYEDERVERALKELARAYQAELENAYHVPNSRKATRRAIQATDCLYSLIGPELGHKVRNDLKNKIFNTPLRQKWGRRVQRNFQGEQIPTVEDYSPEANCPFLKEN